MESGRETKTGARASDAALWHIKYEWSLHPGPVKTPGEGQIKAWKLSARAAVSFTLLSNYLLDAMEFR
jgi:hypothetical protein